MEIRAKISLAVEQFKTNAAVVGGIFKDMTGDAKNYTKNVDSYIAKNLSNRINASNAGKIADIRNLTEFEKEIYKSRRRMEKEALNAQMRGGGNERQQVTVQQYQPKSLYRQTEIAAQSAVDAKVAATRKLYRQEELLAQERMDKLASNLKSELRQFKSSAEQKFNYAKQVTNKQIADAKYAIGYAKLEAAEKIKNAKYAYDYLKLQAEDKIQLDKKAQKALQASLSTEEFNQSLVRTRYALYDVGTKMVTFGATITAALGAAIMKSAEFESAFTRVERTTGATGNELQKLKKALMDIATTSPVSYEDITKVATLGAQMGIATDAIDEFTKTVSNFSAITGVSVEETAQAFGRLGQLLDVPASKFENLSSAITFVGVNAVATDREILNMSESIAAASNQAGFAADEVIGLSGALASLKVRPEEARGVIVRLFREIDSSVSEGGTRLEDFAKLMGYTSDQASSLWKQDPSKFFQSFLTGAKASGDLNGAISALGITNSRELNVIQRLANNTDVLAASMRDAREQFLLGTYAGDAYGKVQDDLQSKLTILKNVIDQLTASFGDSLMAPMKIFVDILIEAGKILTSIPGPIKFVISLITAIAGGFLFFKGTMMLAIAGIFAMKTAMEGLGGTSLRSMATFTGLRSTMQAVGLVATKEALSLRLLQGQFAATTRSTLVNNAANYAMVKGARAAIVANKMLAGSMILLQRAMGPLMLIGTVALAIATAAEMARGAAEETKRLGESMVEAGGGAEELRTAMMKDTAVYNETGKAIGKLNFMYDDKVQSEQLAKISALETAVATEAQVESIQGAEVATGKVIVAKDADAKAQEELNALTERGTQLTKEQTLALGANTAAFVARSLTAYGEESKNFYEEFTQNQDSARWEAAGFDIAKLIANGLSKDGGAAEYINKIKADLINLNSQIQVALNDDKFGDQTAIANKVIDDWGKSSGKTAIEIQKMKDAQKAANYQVANFNEMDKVAQSIDTYRASMESAAAAAELQIQVLIDQGFSAEAAADQVSGLSEQLDKYLESTFSTINATAKVNSSFLELSNGVKETGGSLDIFTEDGRSNMENFQNFMVASLAASKAAGTGLAGGIERISAALIVLENNGYDTSEAFDLMTEYIARAANGEQYTELATNIRNATDPSQLSGIIDAWINTYDVTTEAGKAALLYGSNLKSALSGGGYAKTFLMQWQLTKQETQETAKNVKTILQYASELGKVLKESIDIKFSRTSGLIQLKNTVADINKGIKEARASIASLEASISEKTLTRAQLTTDMQMASQFGDVAEVARIRGEIATLDAEIAASQEDVAYNVGIATGSLDLNTQAGRDNVTTIKDLTTAHAENIEQLVASGASTEEVNAEIAKSKIAFEKQLKAMGLSRTEIKKYTTAFDGFLKIAKGVPKDVTVGANTDPAVTALNNFLVQVNNSKASVKLGVVAATKEERLAVLKAEQNRLGAELGKYKNQKRLTGSAALVYNELKSRKASIDAYIDSGNYRDGGLIQGTGGNKQDNISINASRGEFMMNAGSVSRYGVDFMNALNQQRLPMGNFGGGMSAGGNSSGGVVYLSARDRELLQAAVNRPITLRTTNRVIAQSANDGNRELANRGNN